MTDGMQQTGPRQPFVGKCVTNTNNIIVFVGKQVTVDVCYIFIFVLASKQVTKGTNVRRETTKLKTLCVRNYLTKSLKSLLVRSK